jgi:hypothetical protein
MTLRDGLLAEYLFRGNASDSSGNGRHGAVHGATLTADRFGAPDSAYRFDGIDDEIVVSPPPVARSALSVSVWACFDPRDLSKGEWSNCIIAQDDGNDDDQSRRVFQVSAHGTHLVWHRMICSRDPECKQRIRFGEWYHVAATVADGRHTLYVDGVRHDAVEGELRSHPEQPLHIGRKGTAEPHFFFRGAIDDVRIYDRALAAEEVRALFHEGGFTKPPRRPSSTRRDPISGRWGEHGVNFLDLRFDGAKRVTGHVMDGRPERRAPIDTGTFDPETGALRLEGVGRHFKTGERHQYVIEGTLDEGEVTLTATFGGWSGNFCLTKNGARWPWRYTVARTLDRLIRRGLGLSRSHHE